MSNNDKLFVRKTGDITRNLERLNSLERDGYKVPKVLEFGTDYIDMEYIHGLDIKTYLSFNNINRLQYYIINTIKWFSLKSVDFDYTETYHKKLDWVDSVDDLPFTKQRLIDKLPKILPKSTYHGDMTLENLMFSNDCFYMIDPVYIEYDSWVFDIAKMRQDLECRWFLRNDNVRIGAKLNTLQKNILKEYPIANDDYLLILMLLRVYRHTTKDDENYKFIMREVNRLWK
jgi:RIO-like serine/threonine protein kinase